MATYIVIVIYWCVLHNKPHDDSDKRLYNSPLYWSEFIGRHLFLDLIR